MNKQLLTGIAIICVSVFLTVVFTIDQNPNAFYAISIMYFVVGLMYVSNYVRSKKKEK